MSLINIEKSKGLIAAPCGTPAVISLITLNELFIFTQKILFSKKSFNQHMMKLGAFSLLTYK